MQFFTIKEQLLSIVPECLLPLVNILENSSYGRSIPLLKLVIDGVKLGEVYSFDIAGTIYQCPVSYMNCFYYALSQKTLQSSELCDFYFDLLNVAEYIDYDFELYERPLSKCNHESGQSKILCGLIETCYSLPPQDLTILVIGSSSENNVVSGLGYDSFFLFMSTAGYSGTVHMYDPHDINNEYWLGRFHIFRFKAYFEYLPRTYLINEKCPTIIWDDAYKPSTNTVFPIASDCLIGKLATPVPEGLSKFVLKKDGKIIQMYSGLREHREISGGYSGGYIYADSLTRSFHCFGTSQTYGAYAVSDVKKCLPDAHCSGALSPFSHRLLDPDQTLVKFHEQARITMKFFGEELLPGYRIFRQPFYKGVELRAMYNCPVSSHDLNITRCFECAYIDSAVISIDGYSHRNTFRNLIDSVVGKMCYRNPGVKFAQLLLYITNYAVRCYSYHDTVEAICARFEYDENAVHRAIRYLIRLNRVELATIDAPHEPGLFPNTASITVPNYGLQTGFFNFNCDVFTWMGSLRWHYYDLLTKKERFYRHEVIRIYSGKSFVKKASLPLNMPPHLYRDLVIALTGGFLSSYKSDLDNDELVKSNQIIFDQRGYSVSIGYNYDLSDQIIIIKGASQKVKALLSDTHYLISLPTVMVWYIKTLDNAPQNLTLSGLIDVIDKPAKRRSVNINRRNIRRLSA